RCPSHPTTRRRRSGRERAAWRWWNRPTRRSGCWGARRHRRTCCRSPRRGLPGAPRTPGGPARVAARPSIMLRGEGVQELSDVVLDLAGDGEGVGDVEVAGPRAGVLAVFQLAILRLNHA